MNNKKKYYLSSSTRRFFARAFDFFISFILIFLSSLLIFKDFYFKNADINNIDNRAVFLYFSITSFFILFLYFVFFPYFFKGRTLFKFLFKIRVIYLNKNKSYYFYHLVKKEFFIWGFISIFNIIISIMDLVFFKNKSFIEQVYFSDIYDKLDLIVIIFRSINSALLILFLFININLFIKSKKRTSLDYISKTAVVYNSYKPKEITNNKKDVTKMHNKLPGIIDLTEIDKLIDNRKEKDNDEKISR